MFNRRKRPIFFTWPSPVSSSSEADFSSLSASPLRMASFLFSRATMTNGNVNLVLYLRYKRAKKNKEPIISVHDNINIFSNIASE